MRFFICVLLFILLSLKGSFGASYFVSFKYKKSSGYSFSYPGQYLSLKSVNRRINQSIALDSTDLPVDSGYIAMVSSQVQKVVYASKWLNGILVEATTEQANLLFQNPAIKDVQLVYASQGTSISKKTEDPVDIGGPAQSVESIYGEAYDQVALIEGFFLHSDKKFGEGIIIAVLDAGYENYRNLSTFSEMKANVVDEFDFIDNAGMLRASDTHGTKVLSLLGGVVDGKFYGSATKAKYALYVTESSMFEQLVEEYTWCLAAERADSLGCDIISSSLGYNKFDITSMNHSVSDLGQNSAPVTIAANTAFHKGILVVVAAGNEGNNSWKYITFPADAQNVLAVGAVTNVGKLGVFSSLGYPESVKPDIVCMGVATSVVDNNGNVVKANGTSYSAPQIAGFAACLWQAFPEASVVKIRDAICKSSSNVATPNSSIGYGIPNFEKAYAILRADYPLSGNSIIVRPNPVTSTCVLELKTGYSGTASCAIYDLSGRVVLTVSINFAGGISTIEGLDKLSEGLYVIRVIFGGSISSAKLIKTS